MGRIKGLYIAFHDADPSAGVSQKIFSQVDAFNDNGVDMSLLTYKSKNGIRTAYVDNQELAPVYSGIKCVFFEIKLYPKIVKLIEDNKVVLLFIRYTQRIDYFYLRFLRKCKQLNCTILLEIPTYPYDGEFANQSFKHKMQILVEKFFRRFLKFYVTRIVTTSEFKTILGIDSIRISNAVDDRKLRLAAHTKKSCDEIMMISVANISFWHGLDRLIKGLYNYYLYPRDISVKLTIVGGGDKVEISKVLDLISNLNLQQYVTYVGPKHGTELNVLYDKADLAVGCLACHRKNILEVKSLKNVEYAMRGFPFFYSENNTDFDDKPYVFKVPADDTDIIVEQIVDFYMGLSIKPDEIRASVSNLTWDNQIKKILEDSIC